LAVGERKVMVVSIRRIKKEEKRGESVGIETALRKLEEVGRKVIRLRDPSLAQKVLHGEVEKFLIEWFKSLRFSSVQEEFCANLFYLQTSGADFAMKSMDDVLLILFGSTVKTLIVLPKCGRRDEQYKIRINERKEWY